MKAPAKDVLRIGGGNVYINNPQPAKAAQVAARTRSHSWGWSEAGRLVDEVRDLANYRVLSAFGFADMSDANDCIMMVRKGLAVRHFSMTQVCDDSMPSKIAHDRTFSMIAYEAPFLGKVGRKDAVVCHIAIHPNWIAGYGADNEQPGVIREYIESMEGLANMLAFAKAMGWLIVVSGDFNLPPRKSDRSYTTTYDLFKQYRLKVKTDGIDGVAWDNRLDLVEWHTIGKRTTKSDHDVWTVADLRRKTRRK